MSSRRARSFADYARVVRGHKLALLVPALILAVATWVTVDKLPNLYESTAFVAITPVGTDVGSELSLHLNGFRQLVRSREVLDAVSSKNKLQDAQTDSAVSLIADRIAIEPDTNRYSQPGVFTISYRATDPEISRSVTRELTDRLITQTAKEPSSASEAEALRNRASDISVHLRDLEDKYPWLIGTRSDISAVSKPARTSQPSLEAMRAQQMSIESLKDQQYKFQQQLADVDGRITAQRTLVDQQKKGSTLRDNPTYAALISKRAELQGQRDTLINRQELTDKHPRVLGINDQIAAINRQIEELRQQDTALVSQSPEARDLTALESERNRFKIDLEVTGRELARRSLNVPAQAAAPEATTTRRDPVALKLVQEYFDLKRSYREVTNTLQSTEAKLKPSDGSGLIQLRLIEAANLPEVPLSPNRLLLVCVAAAVGLALGIAFVFLAEAGRFNLLQDARDVEYYARLPLLAAIPRTITESERRLTRRRAKVQLTLATVMCVVTTFALAKVFIASNIFALITKK